MKYSKVALSNANLLARWRAKGLNVPDTDTALHARTILRKICAHHGRIWNRRFPQRPQVYAQAKRHFTDQQSYCFLAVVMRLIARRVDLDNEWPLRLLDLFQTHPAISPKDLGFPVDWQHDPLWN